MRFHDDHISEIALVLEVFKSVFSVGPLVSSNYNSIFNRAAWENFFRGLGSLEDEHHFNTKTEKEPNLMKNAYFQMFVVNILISMVFIYDGIIYLVESYDTESYYLKTFFPILHLLFYYNHLLIVFICNIVLCIKSKYDDLDQMLKQCELFSDNTASQTIKKAKQIYYKLDEIVTIFNELFAWQMLTYIFYSCSVLLTSLNYVDKMIKMNIEDDYFRDKLILYALYSLICFVSVTLYSRNN